jgi:hypothetical protein
MEGIAGAGNLNVEETGIAGISQVCFNQQHKKHTYKRNKEHTYRLFSNIASWPTAHLVLASCADIVSGRGPT